MKSIVPQGQMIVRFNEYLPAPEVWIKASDNEENEPSLFVKNEAVVKFAINPDYIPDITERRLFTDGYYKSMVEQGKFVPISDLNEVEKVCKEKGWPEYKFELGF